MKTATTKFRSTPEWKEALKARTKARGQSLSTYIRMAVESYESLFWGIDMGLPDSERTVVCPPNARVDRLWTGSPPRTYIVRADGTRELFNEEEVKEVGMEDLFVFVHGSADKEQHQAMQDYNMAQASAAAQKAQFTG